MRKPAVLLCVCLTIGACSSSPQRPEIPSTLSRVKPVEAMGPSRQAQITAACKFDGGVWRLGLEAQAAFIRNCVEILGHNFRLEVADRQVLVRWIEAE